LSSTLDENERWAIKEKNALCKSFVSNSVLSLPIFCKGFEKGNQNLKKPVIAIAFFQTGITSHQHSNFDPQVLVS
jgi:hypothetical protein